MFSRPIAYLTYKEFAKKYKIKLFNKKKVNGVYKYSRKSMKQLQKEIYAYEKNNDDVKVGLYFY